MKSIFRKIITGTALCLTMAATATLTSCDNNDGWYPEHPEYYNKFYDQGLNGTWKLISDNKGIVEGTEVNYLEFNGNGRGVYYFYSNGMPESEPLVYNCQGTDSSISNSQLNVQYGNGVPTSMYYWFTPNRLWMQWRNASGIHTYCYVPSHRPW